MSCPAEPVARGERGSALVELLGGTIVLLVPLVYLVLTLVQVQGAQLAATGAARDAARLVATADPELWSSLTAAAVELAFADQGLAVDGSRAVTIVCQRDCGPGDRVVVTVRAAVALPFLPEGTGYTAEGDAWGTIDPHREHP